MEKTMTLKTTPIARLVGAAATLLALGCSSGTGTTNSDPAAMFTGAWKFGSGSITPNCNLTIPPFDLTGDTMTITRVSATEVSTSLTGTGVMCNVNFNVSGTTATAVSGQTCLVTVMLSLAGTPTTVPVTIDITSWTLNVSGNMLSINMSGTATAEAGLINCTPTADGTATRSGDGGA
jgi:hypothetical protein